MAYEFTPFILPMFVSVLAMAALALYGLRHRSVPGALTFAALMVGMMVWGAGAILEQAARDVSTQIFWLKFEAVCELPAVATQVWFAVEYLHLNRWLTRRTITLFVVPSLLILLLVITDDAHHLLWLGFTYEGHVRPVRSVLNWVLVAYGYFWGLASLAAFVWLYVRSPRHRVPVALILCGLVVTRVAYVLDALNLNPVFPMDPAIVFYSFPAAMYALALFRFRLFDLIPIARETVIAQMPDGMLVLDFQWQVVDLNHAAEGLLGMPARLVRGRKLKELPASAEWLRRVEDASRPQFEIAVGDAGAARWLAVQVSPIQDGHEFLLGRLVLLRDVTGQKQAQAGAMEQQRTLATLQERERLARELHDSVGQVLGYTHLQLEAVHALIADGRTAIADAQLARLASVAQSAHADVREYILNLRVGPSAQQPFCATVREYLDRFAQNYEIRTELVVAAGLEGETWGIQVQAQLFRIIQEALSNVRKHGQAKFVQLTLGSQGDQVCLCIQDDGRGFDPASAAKGSENGFGIQIMRERAEELGGRLTVQTAIGQGTRVTVYIPANRSLHASPVGR